MSVLRPLTFFVCRAFTRQTSNPFIINNPYNGFQYTPVLSMATLLIPHRFSHFTITSKSQVNAPNCLTGSLSRSGGTATACTVSPISIPAALGRTTCICTTDGLDSLILLELAFFVFSFLHVTLLILFF